MADDTSKYTVEFQTTKTGTGGEQAAQEIQKVEKAADGAETSTKNQATAEEQVAVSAEKAAQAKEREARYAATAAEHARQNAEQTAAAAERAEQEANAKERSAAADRGLAAPQVGEAIGDAAGRSLIDQAGGIGNLLGASAGAAIAGFNIGQNIDRITGLSEKVGDQIQTRGEEKANRYNSIEKIIMDEVKSAETLEEKDATRLEIQKQITRLKNEEGESAKAALAFMEAMLDRLDSNASVVGSQKRIDAAKQIRDEEAQARKDQEFQESNISDSDLVPLDKDEARRLKGEVSKALLHAADENRKTEAAEKEEKRAAVVSARQKEASERAEAELQILKAKADGQAELAANLERELKVKTEAAQYAAKTNASEEQALAYAREKVGYEDRILASKNAQKAIDDAANRQVEEDRKGNTDLGRKFDTAGREITNDPVDKLGNSKRGFRDLDDFKDRQKGDGLAGRNTPSPEGPAGSAASATEEAGKNIAQQMSQAVSAIKEFETSVSGEIGNLTAAISSLKATLTANIAKATAAANRANQDA